MATRITKIFFFFFFFFSKLNFDVVVYMHISVETDRDLSKHKRNGVWAKFRPKWSIFTRGYTTHEHITFDVHSMK